MPSKSDPSVSDSLSGTPDATPIPSWCEWRTGGSPILLIAPHGGRRPHVDAAAPPPYLRVNDVYTPEITRELATALDASCVINHGMDRNVLDLNRISRVRKDAPWFLELLTRLMGHSIERHGRVELLFVHGWNTGLTSCDLGIGAVETSHGLHIPDGAHMTVDEAYRRERIESLRAACTRAAIRAPLGERYPGSHRNNLLQLFTPRAAQVDHPCAQRIATWVAEGRVNALQLELGIPLRWPGRWRSGFVAALTQTFGEHAPVTASPIAASVHPDAPDPQVRVRSAALQFYDAAADIGLLAGIGRAGPRVTGGRLLLFLGGQRVALYTGEEVHASGNRVGPLHMTREGESLQLDFSGPVLQLDDANEYLDLEAALAQSHLVEVDVHIDFINQASSESDAPHFGVAHGHVAINGQRHTIECGAFTNAAGFRAAGAAQQTMLAAAFGTEHGLLTRVVDGASDSTALHFAKARPPAWDQVRMAVTTDGDAYTPGGFVLSCDGQPSLHAHPITRMPILRPAGDARYLRVTFGTARFDWNGQIGYGLYEYARPVGASDQ